MPKRFKTQNVHSCKYRSRESALKWDSLGRVKTVLDQQVPAVDCWSTFGKPLRDDSDWRLFEVAPRPSQVVVDRCRRDCSICYWRNSANL